MGRSGKNREKETGRRGRELRDGETCMPPPTTVDIDVPACWDCSVHDDDDDDDNDAVTMTSV